MAPNEESPLQHLLKGLAPRRLWAQLIGSLGSLLLVCAISSPLYSKHHELNWGLMIVLGGFGLFLLCCTMLLVKPSLVENKHPLWFPAVFGLICSACLLICGAGLIMRWKLKSVTDSLLFDSVFMLAAGASVISAISCIVTSFTAFRSPRQKSDAELGSVGGNLGNG